MDLATATATAHDDWWWDGPKHWDPIDACVSAQGPFGFVQGSACI